MRSPYRSELTAPWGFSPEAGSGVRVRPPLQEPTLHGEPIKHDAIDAPDTQRCWAGGTERMAPADQAAPVTQALAPVTANVASIRPLGTTTVGIEPSTQRLRPSPAARPSASAPARASEPSTQRLARRRRASPAAQPSVSPTRASQPPPTRSQPPPAPLEAAVHASVYASVHAVLLAASHLSRSPSPQPPPAAAPVGWTPAQRIYVLATAVALSVMATAIFFLALGSVDTHGSNAPRAPHSTATAASPLDKSSVGSAARKDPSASTDRIPVTDAPPRRAPASSISQGRASGPISTGGSTNAGPTSAKLDDAARSAQMLREQLSTTMN